MTLVSGMLPFSGATALSQHGSLSHTGGLVKVSSDLHGERFAQIGLTVKAMVGNMLAVELPSSAMDQLGQIKGIRSVMFDLSGPAAGSSDLRAIVQQYSGAGAVIGILDNQTRVSPSDRRSLQKLDAENGVGFISYLSDDPSSTVIIRNLGNGESDLVQALAFMQQYARTVNRPLVVDMRLQSSAMANPLFLQTCQNLAADGIHFMTNGSSHAMNVSLDARQFSVALFNPFSGQLTDHMPFWAGHEAAGQEMMLAGSDGEPCSFRFSGNKDLESIHVENRSEDIVLLQMIDLDGTVHSYHVRQSNALLSPRVLVSGLVIMDDGKDGVIPFQSKSPAATGGKEVASLPTLSDGHHHVVNLMDGKGNLTLQKESGRKLLLQLSGLQSGTGFELTDQLGNVVYRNALHPQANSVETRIDLSTETCGLYFLRVYSPAGSRTFAVMMN